MRIAKGMDVAFRSCDLTLGDFENSRLHRCVQITARADLDFSIAALLNERWEPTDLEVAANQDKHVGLLELQYEARLCFDEVRVLIASCDRVHGDAIAPNFARDRREILRGRHNIQFALRSRWRSGCQKRCEND